MYITETTENVRKIFEKLEAINDIGKMKFILYILDVLNNNHINNENVINPNLLENDNLIVFNLEAIDVDSNIIALFIEHNITLYNRMINTNEAYEENGSIIGIQYNENDNKIISNFEKLSFEEKLDLLKELFIKYDNETYFENNNTSFTFDLGKDGFEIARLIQEFKNNNLK